MQLGATRLDRAALVPGHDLARGLDDLRACLAGPAALFWLGCCSAFGHSGRHFARALAERLGCTVAGHTHIIGFFQSGTHSLRPGAAPAWDPREGTRYQDGEAAGALWSVGERAEHRLVPHPGPARRALSAEEGSGRLDQGWLLLASMLLRGGAFP